MRKKDSSRYLQARRGPRAVIVPPVLECGGKRCATLLWIAVPEDARSKIGEGDRRLTGGSVSRTPYPSVYVHPKRRRRCALPARSESSGSKRAARSCVDFGCPWAVSARAD